MAVVINGTTGISGVDGSAGTPALQGNDPDTGIFYGTNTVSISTNGSAAVTVDATGSTTFAAQTLFSDGTVSAPAISNTGDTNCGIYFPAADNVAIATGGVAALTADSSQNVSVTNTLAMGSSFKRNRIINGDMRVDQRNAGASVTPTASAYTLDRWDTRLTQASKYSVQQSTTIPNNTFINSLLATSASAYSVLSSDNFGIQQVIEGFNSADLAWGTSDAKAITVSFWARSSIAGTNTYAGSLRNNAADRSYVFTYALAANTWTYVTVTVPGPTSGTWLTNNSGGIYLQFSLGTGSNFNTTAGAWQTGNYLSTSGATSIVGTNGATFYITGVQLEVGSIATPYERQIYSEQLAQCQRYYCMTFAQGTVPANNTTTTGALRGTARTINASSQIEPAANWRFPVTMRASPTVTLYSSGTGATTAQWNNDGSTSYSANARSQFIGTDNVDINNAGVVLTASVPWQIQATASAEL